MNRAAGGQSQGYTILETLIFLAISGAMFLMVSTLINGRQGRAEFTSGVRNFQAVIQDVANDVSDGYYGNGLANGKYLKCDITGINTISLSQSNTDTQGNNQGCIFIGKTLQLAPNGFPDKESSYALMPLVGRQFVTGKTSAGGYVSSYAESGVKGATDAVQTGIVSGRPTIVCAIITTVNIQDADNVCSTDDATTVGFVSFITKFKTAGVTGSSQVDMIVSSSGSPLNQTPTEVANRIESDIAGAPNSITVNPSSGVYICLQSNASKQRALIKLGGQASRFSTSLTINEKSC